MEMSGLLHPTIHRRKSSDYSYIPWQGRLDGAQLFGRGDKGKNRCLELNRSSIKPFRQFM